MTAPRYPVLFSEWRLGPLTLRNRLTMSAMTTGFGYDSGVPNEDLLAYFAARSGDVAMTTVAFGAVAPEGRVEQQIPWMWRPDAAAALSPLAATIAATGAVPCLQLGHGGRQVSPKVTGMQPVAPSPVAPQVHVDVAPHSLSTDEVESVVDAFVSAAGAAQQAGFTAIEVHAAHGYLIQQFLSPESNLRDDLYGEDRHRFGVEIVEGIRRAVPELAVIVRINGSDLVAGGMQITDAVTAAQRLVGAGAQALLVSAGVYGSVPYTIPLLDDPEGCFLDLAAAVRRVVDVPVIGVGRITTPDTAERALAAGEVDAVAIGRALLADPEWVAKAAAGRVADIRPCIATVQGCAGMLQFGNPISCAVNPEVGREGRPPPVSPQPRSVTVIGGGPAGMEAARRAAELGHRVTLLERSAELGGQLRWAAATPPLRHFGKLIDWYRRQLDQLGVEVRLGTTGGTAAGPTIVATGATTVIPALDGFDVMAAWTLEGLMAGEAATTGIRAPAGRVAVIGGGQRALALALHLASQVESVVMISADRFGADTSGLARRGLLDRCDAAGIERLAGVVGELNATGVILGDGAHVACDAVVLAAGMRSDPPAVTGARVGDAVIPGDLAAAIAGGRQAAEAI
jgi:2,4-dienoyl-CoA reductase-like NADH-dependent reductase (Old Yellow Enzyme family)